MKYQVKIENKTYTVEIEDINARPVLAKVEDEIFEVFPEGGGSSLAGAVAGKVPAGNLPAARVSAAAATSPGALVSPLPGTVTEVFVRAGEEVEAGAILLVIEAMKMKNSIRSVRAGRVAAVLVQAGQSVAHKQTLVEFEA